MKVVIGLGTNLGEKLKNLNNAISFLVPNIIKNPICSSIYETQPWGVVEQPKFFNMIIIGETLIRNPIQLVSEFKRIEKLMGRIDTIKYGPRLIDIDLVAYGEEYFNEDGIIVPHEKLEEREFVLLPFEELWPSWRHPILKLTASEMLKVLSKIRPFSSTVVVTRQQNIMIQL